MATKKPSKTNADSGNADPGKSAPTPTPSAAVRGGGRGGRRPGSGDTALAWNAERDTALITSIQANPGRLTTNQLAAHLAQHEAFSADAGLVTAEKVRQRVKKLSDRAAEMGLPRLEVKRMGNAGYDPGEVLSTLLRPALAPAVPVPVTAQGSSAGGVVPAPAGSFEASGVVHVPVVGSTAPAAGPSTVTIPQFTGLIPTAQG
jgi:hypothetical protein